MNPLSIYIHIPFCKRKCAYCDFASFAGREHMYAAYFAALGTETEVWKETLRAHTVRSVFFGGGTPSLPDASYICAALAHIRALAEFAPDAEITIEANPGTADARKLDAYLRAGINRISFGVQSLNAEMLASLGRIHDPAQAVNSVRLAKACGFDNISIDLMYALPGQTMKMWHETLASACELPIAHVSAYSLIVEENTPMFERVLSGCAVLPDDDTVNEMQRMAIGLLAGRGFARYEISNFARPGFESRHNLNYWLGGEYLGLGSAAHSLMGDERFANPTDPDEYIAGVRRIDVQRLTPSDRMEEAIMLETRTVRGLDLSAWRARFGEDFVSPRKAAIAKLENYGMIEIADGYLRLTPIGMEMQDSVVLELL